MYARAPLARSSSTPVRDASLPRPTPAPASPTPARPTPARLGHDFGRVAVHGAQPIQMARSKQSGGGAAANVKKKAHKEPLNKELARIIRSQTELDYGSDSDLETDDEK